MGEIFEKWTTYHGEWLAAVYRDIKPGTEFIHENILFYVHTNGVFEMSTTIDAAKLADTDRAYDRNNYRMPTSEDVIRLPGFNGKPGRYKLVHQLHSDQLFYFQGKEYLTFTTDDPGIMGFRDTGRVLAVVTNTYHRKTDDVFDLTIRDENGDEWIITGTSEHPFYIPAIDDYVALVNLKSGDELLTAEGNSATVVKVESHPGELDVYNFEVDGVHNYYIASAHEGPSILVHNTCNVHRSIAARNQYLHELAGSGNAPRWMNQWLSEGRVPPGYHVDHIKPLFRGGADVPSNMRLKLISDHINRHRYLRPGGKIGG